IIAAYSGSADVVQKLLESGANFNVRDADGRTALTLASSGGHMEAVQKLLESGAEITPYDCVVTKESGYMRLEELLATVKGLREEWRDCPLEIINVEIVPYIFSGEAPTKWIIYTLCRTFYCSLCDGNKFPR
ncbi:MAG: ankyrin repeat domain-containing protein, partial [Candidatus Babeliales bacterium]